MKKLFLWVFLSLLFFSPLDLSLAGSTLRIKGTSSMLKLAGLWAKKYMELYPQEKVIVEGANSKEAFSSLISGASEIAMSSRRINAEEISLAKQKAVNPFEAKVAFDALAVVVNPENPLDRLSLQQVAWIFRGDITDWEEVGGRHARIIVFLLESDSGNRFCLKDDLLKKACPAEKEKLHPEARIFDSSQRLAEEVALNPAAIGFLGMGFVTGMQKVVAVACDEKNGFIAPSKEALSKGKYPFLRPLFFYTNGKPKGAIKKFIDFVYSAQAQKIASDCNMPPISP